MKHWTFVLLALLFLTGCLPQGGNGEAYEIVEGPKPDGVAPGPSEDGTIPDPPPPPAEGLDYAALPAGVYHWERPHWTCQKESGEELPSPVWILEKAANGKWFEKGTACKPVNVPVQHSRNPIETQSVLLPVVGFGRGSFVYQGQENPVRMRVWCRDIHGDWEWAFTWDGNTNPYQRRMRLYGRTLDPQVVETDMKPGTKETDHWRYESQDGAYVVEMDLNFSAVSPLKRAAVLTGPDFGPVSLVCRTP